MFRKCLDFPTEIAFLNKMRKLIFFSFPLVDLYRIQEDNVSIKIRLVGSCPCLYHTIETRRGMFAPRTHLAGLIHQNAGNAIESDSSVIIHHFWSHFAYLKQKCLRIRIKVLFLKCVWFVRLDINTGMTIILAWNDEGYALVIPLK